MVFNFDTGITAIVGPNGSGKSNIADAVRWVLGEQSAKQLRGNKMEDVIFAGTETRKALGFCQVDLTIDNHDMKMPIEYSEVTISRRVYRSGESEYYLNGTLCRMKDIHELFMDTGVGKEGYSIIGQGQIDKILSSKPDDRRALFDEAAGIVKYKNRKASAEKKLLDEKANLTRIHDIIRELEGQSKTLEHQSVTAKAYLKLREELKKYELNIFVRETQKLTEQIKEVEEKETDVIEQMKSVEASYHLNKERHSELNAELESLDRKLEENRENMSHVSAQKERNEANVAITLEQITHLSANNSRFAQQIQNLVSKQALTKDELASYKEQISQWFEEAAKEEEKLIKSQLSLGLLDKSIEEQQKRLHDSQSDIIEEMNLSSHERSKLQRYEALIESQEQKEEALLERLKLLDATRVSLNLEIKGLEAHQSTLEAEQNSAEARIAQVSKEILKVKSQRAELEHQNKSQHHALATAQSRHAALSDIEEHYEGYQYSTRQIMQLKKTSNVYAHSIVGVVADVLTVKERYERAIEIALGGNFQNIITDNDETAKALIGYLKEQKAGRATFLPMNTIKAREPKRVISQQTTGFLGYANDLIETDERFKPIMSFLLGGIGIVDTMDNALVIAKQQQFSVRLVTLAGDVINPGGSLTGGAFKNDKNQFLARRRELETYATNIEAFTKAIKELEQALVLKEQAFMRLETEQNEVTKHYHELQITVNQEAHRLNQSRLEAIKLDDEKILIDKDLQSIKALIVQYKEEWTTMQEKLELIGQGKRKAEEQVKALMVAIEALKVERLKESQINTALQVSFSTMEVKRQNAKEHIARMETQIKELDSEIIHLNQEIEVNQKEIVDKQETNLRTQEVIKDLQSQLVVLETSYQEVNGKKQSLSKAQEALYEKREDESRQMNLLEKETGRLENQKLKYELQKDNHLEYMWNEYEITYNQALSYLDDTLGTMGNVKQIIGDYKQQIKELGDVNVNAIEDYRQVKERFDFLTVQRDDLLLAEERLLAVIADLDERMKEQFREKFFEINHEFGRVFQELFGGGKAYMEMADEENVLETGIHIHAQPPGKKLQNMMLLSGGERAFTAIALLFAIQSLKPSPFCVLDEIEAALDDSNVNRFANYLHKLTVNTQFIVITHRRGTMEAADALYGITMQEKGISTQVSVKLIENDLEERHV